MFPIFPLKFNYFKFQKQGRFLFFSEKYLKNRNGKLDLKTKRQKQRINPMNQTKIVQFEQNITSKNIADTNKPFIPFSEWLLNFTSKYSSIFVLRFKLANQFTKTTKIEIVFQMLLIFAHDSIKTNPTI